ncbi:MAG: UbiA family prenyltransferase [Chlorobiota bacterium]|nr:UbiA family prenyltransferase [Chlorobiota bacterium]QQS67643.1 MAG: UbiA family prenyltransferase [Chlorobiota bacterium]
MRKIIKSIKNKLLVFGNMIKFSHSIFALPFAFTSAITVYKIEKITFSLLDVCFLLICMVSARTAAMGFNRIIDKNIDSINPRTKNRELPSGKISINTSYSITIVCIIIFICSSFLINQVCGFLSIPLIVLLLGYSLTKRFTFLSHFVLGLCLGAAPLGVWFSMSGGFHLAPVFLCLGVTFWAAGFDIYYSCQDEKFDKENNLNSLPAKIGALNSILTVRIIHFIAIIFFIVYGIYSNFGLIFYLGLILVSSILIYEAWLLRKGDLKKINLAFFNLNGYVSIIFAITVLIDVLFLSK